MTPQMMLIALALSAAPPTPDQVKSVFDYYYAGQGAPVLAEAFLCSDVETKDKDRKYECNTTVTGTAKKGDSVSVYLKLLIPEGEETTMMIQALHNNVVRATKDVELKSRGMRTRTWKTFRLNKTGKWTFNVLTADGKPVHSLEVTAE